jgi:hypothetical protein
VAAEIEAMGGEASLLQCDERSVSSSRLMAQDADIALRLLAVLI